MPFLASLTDPKPYHILTYGTLLGSNLFQTFINGPLAYNALPRPSFSTLQTAIFPVYFGIQTALPVVLALTWPGERSVAGHVNSGFKGLLAEENKWTALTPIALMFVTNLANLVWLGPATTKVMKERKHQETRDGKKYYDAGPKSPEMQRMNSSFNRLHGAASVANLIGLGGLLVYAFTLAEKI
ncbi:unnamed protein product [Zymoseptoria tritici ST99CH_1A5]|uniref:TMEM205-like domain-containing protein n=3 Tax=Zymoseptoria tritici TaxID=1047171 RepID=A0A1X7RRV1_ZYMT9|nr:unnamed protein product [Zymoseptoria tritici ST99CH_3D7]SMR51119.1 unnamed protein product [Zymoseptoria tritici ST99CH_1E4]SMR52056.1 unnamed protein product [Zymoseptoria tritici ST99CH_3D1]SMY23813.1 unnamed protein product [Zymoseptoria tritici ST99CH_1A5]